MFIFTIFPYTVFEFVLAHFLEQRALGVVEKFMLCSVPF